MPEVLKSQNIKVLNSCSFINEKIKTIDKPSKAINNTQFRCLRVSGRVLTNFWIKLMISPLDSNLASISCCNSPQTLLKVIEYLLMELWLTSITQKSIQLFVFEQGIDQGNLLLKRGTVGLHWFLLLIKIIKL